MSVLRPCASVLALVVVTLAASQSDARDRSSSGESKVILELSSPSQKGFEDVVIEMAPLRPSTGEAAARRAPIVESLTGRTSRSASAAANAPRAARGKGSAAEPLDIATKPNAAPESGTEAAKVVSEPASPAREAPAAAAENSATQAAPPEAAASPATVAAKPSEASPQAAAPSRPSPSSQTPESAPVTVGAPANPPETALQPVAPTNRAPVLASSPGASSGATANPGGVASQAVLAPSVSPAKQAPATAAVGGAPPELATKSPEATLRPEAATATVPVSPAMAVAGALPAGAPGADAASAARDASAGASAKDPGPVVKAPDQQPKPADVAAPAAAKPPATAAASVAATPPAARATEQPVDPDADKAYASVLARGVRGPAEVRLADRATFWLPAGRAFVAAINAKELYGDGPVDPGKLGVVLPAQRASNWIAFVGAVDDGYVKDQGGVGLDAAQTLAGLRRLAAQENGARRRAGEEPLTLTGWVDPPRYDEKHRLSACVGVTTQDSTDPDDRLVDCMAYALGRQGALEIQIVGMEEDLPRFRNEAATLVSAMTYDHGKAYEDFDPSADKTAPYDLSGLLTGGLTRQQPVATQPASNAQKVGILALIAWNLFKFWKILLIGAAAAFSAYRWLRGKRGASSAPASRDIGSSPVVAMPGLLSGFITSLKDRIGGAKRASPIRRSERAVATGGAPPASSAISYAAEEPSSPLAKITAFIKARAPRGDGASQALQQRRQAQAEAQASSATLSRLAGMMRKQEQGDGDGSGVAAASLRSLAGAEFETSAEDPPKRVLPGAAPVDLVEPGDRSAASAALSAQQALRQAAG